tara:strand:+ start:96 stop:803 length:708 start_codon:yes stop_codon:yes gene_type:complete
MGAKQVQFRRGSTAQHDGTDGSSGFTGAKGEITVDTGTDEPLAARGSGTSDYTARVHDGQTTGGFKLARQSTVDSLNDLDIADGTSIASGSGISGSTVNGGVRYTNSSSQWKYGTIASAVTGEGVADAVFRVLFNSYGTGSFDKPIDNIVSIGDETTATSTKVKTNGSTTIYLDTDNFTVSDTEVWKILALKTTDANHTQLHGTPAIKFDTLQKSNSWSITHGLTNCVWIAIRTA